MSARPALITALSLCITLLAQVRPAYAEPRPGLITGASVPAAGNAQSVQPSQQLIDSVRAFRDAVRGLAAQPAGPQHEKAIRAASKALADAQYALAMERVEFASIHLQNSVREMGNPSSGTSYDLAVDNAAEALREAKQAVSDLTTSSSDF